MTRSRGNASRLVMRALAIALMVAMFMPCIARAADNTHEMWSEDGHWCRVWGDTALDTMQAVLHVQKEKAFEDKRDGTVIVATSDGYWDALAAAGLAGMYDAPVLITPGNKLAKQTIEELKRLSPDLVLVMGGKAAVSDEVFSELEAMSGKWSVERVSGKNASDTAVEIFIRGINAKNDGKIPQGWGDTAIIATSNGYWDALSVAPAAFAKRYPIFLTSYDSTIDGQILSNNTYDAITAGNFKNIVIVGGKAAVSSFVESQLTSKAYGLDQIARLSGASAIDTSKEIVGWELGSEMNMVVTHMMVATSNGYWDALTAAPVAGKLNSVLVLADQFGEHMQAYGVARLYAKTPVDVGYIIGGRMALSEAVSNYIEGGGGIPEG